MYVPLGRLVEVKAILPVPPPQVVEFTVAPAVMLGVAGLATILAGLNVPVVPVHPALVTEKSL